MRTIDTARMTSVALLFILIACALLVFGEARAFAQCSMCRASLAGSNNAYFIRNFNIGVLVLLVPPVAMFCSIFVMLRRHKLRDEELNSAIEVESSNAEDQKS